MHQHLLPHFPTEPLDKEAFERYSEEVIKAYTAVRFTSPIQIQQVIKRTPVILPQVEMPQVNNAQTADAISHVAQESSIVPAIEHEPISSDIAEVKVGAEYEIQVTSPLENAAIAQEPQRCFLHTKPKPATCKRCSTFMEWKQSSLGTPPKRPR
jgi:hypothetical protein